MLEPDKDVQIHNLKLENEMLKNKLWLLTGCSGFGDSDGMNGTCVDCSYDDEIMWRRCRLFQHSFHEFNSWVYEKKKEIENKKEKHDDACFEF